jgi:hypothetical protein
MAENERREKVMLLTQEYRILGEMRLGPDGTLWDFKHKSVDDFVSVFDAQCFRAGDGKRMYDSTLMEVSRRAVIGVFKQQDLAFVRKEAQ